MAETYYIRSWWFHDKDKISEEVPLVTSNKDGMLYNIPSSYIFYCYFCGKVYAKCSTRKIDERTTTPWTSDGGCCFSCESRLFAPGVPESIWINNYNRYNITIPRELLIEEFERQYQYWIKEGGLLC